MRIGYLLGNGSEERILESLAALENQGCDRVTIDSGGRNQSSSPVFSALVSRLHAGDVVVVVDLEELAGSLPQLLQRLNDLATRGIRVETLSCAIDTGDPAVGGAIQSLYAFADRVQTRRDAQRGSHQIRHPGRPSRLVPDDIARARMAIEKEGRRIDDVALEFGVSRATLYRSLKK